jgi:hypothetical protein
MAHRVESLRCEGSEAIGAKRTCRERRKRVDLTKMTRSGGKPGRNLAAQQAPDLMPANPLCWPSGWATGCNSID